MWISRVIIAVMMLFLVLGAADYVFGGRLGLGDRFAEGFRAMGPLALGMVGVNCLAPVLGGVITATIGRFFALLGADPAMAGAVFLSIDTGCYALAHTMTTDPGVADLAAVILGSTLGPLITFAIPVGLSYTPEEDHGLFALGTLCGMVCIPFACVAGALAAGFSLPAALSDLLPVFLLSAAVAAGLLAAPKLVFRGFTLLSRGIAGVVIAALTAAVLSEEIGLTLVQGMAPLSESFVVIGRIAVLLAGAYPMAAVVQRVLKGPLEWMGRRLGVRTAAVNGLLVCCINSIPAYSMLKDMDERGKVLNYAFACCASFALGDHLAFCAGAAPHMVAPMLLAKLSGGVLCVAAAQLLYPVWRRRESKQPA